MGKSIERAIIHAAEAALSHLVSVTKSQGTKVVSEGLLYETIARVLQATNASWVNHEHAVNLSATDAKTTQSTNRGDHKRVDFAVARRVSSSNSQSKRTELTFVDVKVANRTKIKPLLDVTADINKLALGTPKRSSSVLISPRAYLIVRNIQTEETHPGKPGFIMWNGDTGERSVRCIATFKYQSPRFLRTAAVFSIDRS